MAYKDKERKKEDIFIKEKRRAKNFFVTSSAKMDEKGGINKTTISSSVFTDFSASFSAGDFLLDSLLREQNGSIVYMLQEMQHDIDDLYNEASASAFQSSYFPTARIDSGSFADISSSGVVSMLTASIGGGLFTSASLAAGGGSVTVDTTLKNGSTNPVTNNAVYDGLALKLNLTGGVMTGLIRPIVTAVTEAPKNNQLDASQTNVYEFDSSKAITIDFIVPAFPGQEITIMNINSGAVTITRSNKGQARSIYQAKGANLTINQHEAYRLICNQNQLWYVIS
tara:strand:+ start:765 stop:1610 length:846 start_codon:yes stop_codon:yes gene_type:complete